MVPLGTPAAEFRLPSVGGHTIALSDFSHATALLVVFLSNHCPYVRHVERALGRVVASYTGRGLAAVGICSNDTERYPDDDSDHLAEQARRARFDFPYLIDETQEVAKAYRAACTPDFFLYGTDRLLSWHLTPSRFPRHTGRASAAASSGGQVTSLPDPRAGTPD